MMPFRIETDPTLRRACGTDGPAWASAYLANRTARDGDRQHIELAAWFDAAIEAGIAQTIGVPGEVIPVFHNICGRRTVNRSCLCEPCVSALSGAKS